MSLLIKISIIQALVIAPIEIPIGIFAAARGPPCNKWFETLTKIGRVLLWARRPERTVQNELL